MNLYAYIGLGANLGDRLAALGQAAVALGRLGTVAGRSRIYETAPVLGALDEGTDAPPQPPYLNAAILLCAALPGPGDVPSQARALLAGLLAIEAALGRVRDPARRNAPRTLDLDVLLLGKEGDLVVDDPPALLVPHPRLHERAFALRPLLDLHPRLRHPVLGRLLSDLYAEVLSTSIQPPPVPLLEWPLTGCPP